MRAKLIKFWNVTVSSYWLVPSLMALGAVLLSIGTIAVDALVGEGWMSGLQWMYANKPEGARAVLSTIAGSMITVAGVTFSITIASVVYASSSYGPRILGNFMRNRGNQVTLGTFIATFLYCLLILRTVRSAEDLPPGAPEAASVTPAFIPHVSILVGIGLAILSVGMLIYFVHHIAASIYLPNVVASIAHDAMRRVDRLYPKEMGEGRRETPEDGRSSLPEGFVEEGVRVCFGANGYLQTFDSAYLLDVACKHDLVLRVEERPGHFVSEHTPVVTAWPKVRMGGEVEQAIRAAFTSGAQRTQIQDVLFPVDELVEVAARALSPGVNDPYTAMNCLDWLGSLLARMARRKIPDAHRYDSAGHLRVVAEPVRLEGLADAAFEQLIPYFAPDRNAALHMMALLGKLAEDRIGEQIPEALRRYADTLHEAAGGRLHPHAYSELSLLRTEVYAALERHGAAPDEPGVRERRASGTRP